MPHRPWVGSNSEYSFIAGDKVDFVCNEGFYLPATTFKLADVPGDTLSLEPRTAAPEEGEKPKATKLPKWV